MRQLALTLSVYVCATSVSAQTDWEAIKKGALPVVMLTEEFDAPYPQPLANPGWEDGLYISRDGLNLYCIYGPFDILSMNCRRACRFRFAAGKATWARSSGLVSLLSGHQNRPNTT